MASLPAKIRTARPRDVRAAWWTLRATAAVRRQLASGALDSVRLPPVPRVGAEAGRAVRAVLRRKSATCLETALVLQRWRASHGDERELVIGVTAPSKGFKAHAWLEGDPPCHDEGFHELVRRGSPG